MTHFMVRCYAVAHPAPMCLARYGYPDNFR
jgi:hypothetical protein